MASLERRLRAAGSDSSVFRLKWVLCGSLFMAGLACVCVADTADAQHWFECAYDPPCDTHTFCNPAARAFRRFVSAYLGVFASLCVCLLSVCLNVFLSPCLLWMCISKILMRCQLDSSQLITGCTLGVSASLTHSHMLFPVLIFRLGCVMLASHSTHIFHFPPSLSLHLWFFRCGSVACSPCEPEFFLLKHLSAISLSHPPLFFLYLSPCCSGSTPREYSFLPNSFEI